MPEKSLYDRDFTAWVKLTTQQLKDKNFEQLDLENLIDEVESLISEQKKWIRESLIKILTYAMKRLIRLEYDFKTDEEFDRHPYPKTWQLSRDFEFLVSDDFFLNLKK